MYQEETYWDGKYQFQLSWGSRVNIKTGVTQKVTAAQVQAIAMPVINNCLAARHNIRPGAAVSANNYPFERRILKVVNNDNVYKTVFGADVKSQVRTPNYKERVRRGEIIVNDARLATCTIEVGDADDITKLAAAGSYIISYASLTRYGVNLDIVKAGTHGTIQYHVVDGWGYQWQIAFDRSRIKRVTKVNLSQKIDLDFFARNLVSECLGADLPDGFFQECLAEADSGYFDFLTNMAELPKTLQWVADIVRQCMGVYRGFRRGEFQLVKNIDTVKRRMRGKITKKQYVNLKRELKDYLSALADLRLQYRYAALPLAYSLEDAAVALERIEVQYERYRTRDLLNKEVPLPPGFTQENLFVEQTLRVMIKHEYDVRNLASQVRKAIQANLFVTLWELVPGSFIADWFFPVGQLLARLSPKPSLQEKATWSVKAEINQTLQYRYDGDKTIPLNIRVESYRRDVFNPREWNFSLFEPSINNDRILDTFALSWSAWNKNLRIDRLR